MIVEMLPPVDTTQFGKNNVRAGDDCRELMAAKIADLDNEVAEARSGWKAIRRPTPPTRAYCWRKGFPFHLSCRRLPRHPRVWDQWPLYGADDPRLERNDVKLIYSNRLTENVAMTIRGLQVRPLIGGAAHDVAERRLGAGAAYPPERGDAVVSGQRRTGWRNGFTTVWRACGWWKTRSQEPADPNHYGVDDFPVIIQDKRLDNFGTPEYSEPGSGGCGRHAAG